MFKIFFQLLGAIIFVFFGFLFLVEVFVVALITMPYALFLALTKKGNFVEHHKNLAYKWGSKSGDLKAKLLRQQNPNKTR